VDVPAVDGAPKTADPDAALNGRPTDLGQSCNGRDWGSRRVPFAARAWSSASARPPFRAMEPISIQDSIWKSRPRTTPMFSDV